MTIAIMIATAILPTTTAKGPGASLPLGQQREVRLPPWRRCKQHSVASILRLWLSSQDGH